MIFISRIGIIFTLALLFTACGSSSSNDPPPPAPAQPFSSIYVVDNNAQSVMAWDSAGTVNGNVTPDRVISGAGTGIIDPVGIEYDSRSNSVLIADVANAIRIYDDVVITNGNVAASRTITGAATLLDNAYGIALDENRNQIYATNNSGILVFSNADTINGNIAPSRVITGSNVPLATVDHKLALDVTNDRLYISDFDSDSILIYDNISTIDGNVAPNRTVTGITKPWGIAVDISRNILYVNRYNAATIDVFDNAATINGAVAPNRSLTGAAVIINEGCHLAIDPVSNMLYVTTGDDVKIWHNASTVTGNVTPDRTISGSNIGFNRPTDIVGVK